MEQKYGHNLYGGVGLIWTLGCGCLMSSGLPILRCELEAPDLKAIERRGAGVGEKPDPLQKAARLPEPHKWGFPKLGVISGGPHIKD